MGLVNQFKITPISWHRTTVQKYQRKDSTETVRRTWFFIVVYNHHILVDQDERRNDNTQSRISQSRTRESNQPVMKSQLVDSERLSGKYNVHDKSVFNSTFH